MAFKATLIMDQQKSTAAEVESYGGKKYELIECEYEFYQSLDESGKPSSRPQSGLIKFVMPAQGDDDLFFYNWMFNRAETHNGTIEMLLSTDDNQKKYLHLYFEDAY
ncbi:type VI secretion system tube protein TssD, partial [Bacteroides caecigallinarum]|uniref:type VI secretion system tube protein TssD n=1 Tax=Bacteroides caecigallinarum TaxID=1411144 RepID=UPI001F3F62F5